MSSEEIGTALPAECGETEANTVQNNGHVEENASPAKKAKIDGDGETVSKRRSSTGRKKNREDDMMAEARAMLGEIDTSSGRSLRKRPEKAETPKSEEKKKPVSRRNSKKEKQAESVEVDAKPDNSEQKKDKEDKPVEDDKPASVDNVDDSKKEESNDNQSKPNDNSNDDAKPANGGDEKEQLPAAEGTKDNKVNEETTPAPEVKELNGETNGETK